MCFENALLVEMDVLKICMWLLRQNMRKPHYSCLNTMHDAVWKRDIDVQKQEMFLMMKEYGSFHF